MLFRFVAGPFLAQLAGGADAELLNLFRNAVWSALAQTGGRSPPGCVCSLRAAGVARRTAALARRGKKFGGACAAEEIFLLSTHDLSNLCRNDISRH